MTPSTIRIAIAVLFLISAPVQAQVHIQSKGDDLPQLAVDHLNTETGEIADPSDARAILLETLFKGAAAGTLDLDDVYVVIHVLKWAQSESKNPANPTDDQKKEPSASQRWYVYHAGKWSDEDFATRNRVFGVKTLWLLFIHLNRPLAGYISRYQFSITGKTPAPLLNMAGLATFFFNKDAGGAQTPHLWGGGSVPIHTVPSDIKIQPIRVVEAPFQTKYEKLGDPKVFDNEGNYRVDWSVGVPIKAGKELTVDETNATAAPKKIDKQNIFALFNYHFQPVDVKSAGLRRIPHLVAGFAVSEKPQDKLLLGAGWGPAFANFFAGALFVRQPIEDEDGDRWDPQFIFGINMTVRGTKKALEDAKK